MTAIDALDTAVAGTLLAVASSAGSTSSVLTIVDVAVPSMPAELASVAFPGWTPQRVAFDGRRAYMANHYIGLALVDVSDPSAPQVTAVYDPGGPKPSAIDLAIARNHAFIAEETGVLRIVNVANPLWPHEVALYVFGGAAGIDVKGGTAYLSTGDGGLLLLDVGDCTGEMLLDGFESGDAAVWSASVE